MLLVSLTAGQSSIVLFSVIAPTVPLKTCLEAIFLEYNTNSFNQEMLLSSNYVLSTVLKARVQ